MLVKEEFLIIKYVILFHNIFIFLLIYSKYYNKNIHICNDDIPNCNGCEHKNQIINIFHNNDTILIPNFPENKI